MIIERSEEKTKQEFIIPVRLPSLNEVVAANRRNKYAGAKLKSDTEETIMTYVFTEQVLPVEKPCIVHMLFEEATRKRDADNVESAKKFILDALVRARILKGDSPKYVVGSPSFTVYGKAGNQVKVTIIDSDDVERLRSILRHASEVITEE